MVVESRSVIRNAKNARGRGRFARFNTFPLYYLRAWYRLCRRRTGKKHIGALTITKRTLVTLLDVRLSRNSEVHSFYVKSDWYPPVQPSVALERELEEV